jgi:hypothetical protein
VPYKRINLIEYGQKSGPAGDRGDAGVAVVPVEQIAEAFSTVGFTDDEGQQQAMVFRVDKDKIGRCCRAWKRGPDCGCNTRTRKRKWEEVSDGDVGDRTGVGNGGAPSDPN